MSKPIKFKTRQKQSNKSQNKLLKTKTKPKGNTEPKNTAKTYPKPSTKPSGSLSK